MRILVDADACPVKEEIYRVAQRTELPVVLVSNSWMQVPTRAWIELVLVDDAPDAADDWIVEHAIARDIVITADIPLAARCLETGARVIGHKGRQFTEDSIGEALASRELQNHLREMGIQSGGPAPYMPKDRSRFLQKLDQVIQAVRREG